MTQKSSRTAELLDAGLDPKADLTDAELTEVFDELEAEPLYDEGDYRRDLRMAGLDEGQINALIEQEHVQLQGLEGELRRGLAAKPE